MLNLNITTLNKNFSNALQDADFRKSSFFPTNPPMMGDNQFKEFVTQVYQVYQDHKQSLFECVFRNQNILYGILLDACGGEPTFKQFAPYLRVNKAWQCIFERFLACQWNRLKQCIKLPHTMDKIEKNYAGDSFMSKLSAFSKHLCLSYIPLKNRRIFPANAANIATGIHHLARQESHFKRSDWLPRRALMTKVYNEQKDLTICSYVVYQDYKHSMLTYAFGNPDIMYHILKDACGGEPTLKQLAPYLKVNKIWQCAIERFLACQWNRLKQYIKLPHAMGEIEKKHAGGSTMSKLFAFSKHICTRDTSLNNTPITPTNVEKIIYDNALQTVWRCQLSQTFGSLGVLNLPAKNASAHDIRTFLQNCNEVNQVKSFSMSFSTDLTPLTDLRYLKDLTVIPREFNLLNELTKVSFWGNSIEVIENLNNCQKLISLTFQDNKIQLIQDLNLPELRTLDISYNKIKVIQNLNLPKLRILDAGYNKIRLIQDLNLPKLKILTVFNNDISMIRDINFPKLEKLECQYGITATIAEEKLLNKKNSKTLLENQVKETIKMIGSMIGSLKPGLETEPPQKQGMPELLLRLDSVSNTLFKMLVTMKNSELKQVYLNTFNQINANLEHPTGVPDIIMFEQPRKGSLDFFYQAIIWETPETQLRGLFSGLEQKDRELVLQMIETKNTTDGLHQPSARFISMMGRKAIEQAKAFSNLSHLLYAVQETILILSKLDSLSQEMKNEVYGKIYELAGSPKTDDLQWGETHAKDNILTLAEALAMCGV